MTSVSGSRFPHAVSHTHVHDALVYDGAFRLQSHVPHGHLLRAKGARGVMHSARVDPRVAAVAAFTASAASTASTTSITSTADLTAVPPTGNIQRTEHSFICFLTKSRCASCGHKTNTTINKTRLLKVQMQLQTPPAVLLQACGGR